MASTEVSLPSTASRAASAASTLSSGRCSNTAWAFSRVVTLQMVAGRPAAGERSAVNALDQHPCESDTGHFGLGLDLDLPARIQQPLDYDHGCHRSWRLKGFGVSETHRVGIGVIDDVHAGEDDVAQAGSKALERRLDNGQTATHLDRGIGIARAIGPDRRRPGDNYAASNLDRTTEV